MNVRWWPKVILTALPNVRRADGSIIALYLVRYFSGARQTDCRTLGLGDIGCEDDI